MYRLRHDREVLDDVSERLIRLCEAAGLPHAGDSVIAQEINEGAFEPSRSDARAFIYLRKSGLHLHPDFPETLVPVFVEPDSDHQKKLARLKERIQNDAGGRIKFLEYKGTYAGMRIDPTILPSELKEQRQEAFKDGVIHPEDWHFLSEDVQAAIKAHGTVALNGMEELGQQIIEELWKEIEGELKESSEPSDTLVKERLYHELFLTERTRLFLGRGDLLESMLGYAADTEDLQPIVITGKPGCGKSALLSEFARLCRKLMERTMLFLGRGDLLESMFGYAVDKNDRQPLVITGKPGCGKSALLSECARLCYKQFPDALVLPHFIGAAPGSTDLNTTIRSICKTLRRECNFDEEISSDPAEIRVQLPVFLEMAGAKRPVILLLDALNQLDPANHSHELDWFP